MSFVHLHNHTEYSLLDGMCRISKGLQKAKDMGMPALAITDHGALYGAFHFYVKALELGIKPIIGCEVYKASNSRFDKQPAPWQDQDHLVVLAKNLTGYYNLLKLVTDAHMEGLSYKPRVDFELLEKYHEGLIVLSGGVEGELGRLLGQDQLKKAESVLKRYVQIFGDDFYLELQRHENHPTYDKLFGYMVQLSRKHGIPLVAGNDVHYLDKDDAYAQEILLCIQTARIIYEKNRPLSMQDSPDFYLRSPQEMQLLFADYPESIENTLKIADQCNLEIPYGKLILPEYIVPAGFSPEDYLRKLTFDNIKRVEGFSLSEVEERLNYELEIIISKGYATYFLVVQDFVNWAKNNGVAVGPGRGSAAGSLVAYLLRITDINPLEHKIPFERFLNPGRPSPPDIDIDFADSRRDEVIRYVSQKYGEDHVAQIITFGSMEARMVVRDVNRAFGLSYAHGDRIAKMIPVGKQGMTMTIDLALQESSQLKQAYETEEDVKKVIDVARKLEGLPRHSSVHAAGVVLGDKPLVHYVPLQREPKENKVITQYDMYCLDLNASLSGKAVGLMKMDFLGLRNLTILENALDYVAKTSGVKIDIHEVSFDDQKTYELIGRGQTIGVFQLESSGMRRLAKDLKPTRLGDITAMVALYRPGPMALIPQFIESKRSPDKVKYLHPDLEPILKETYGILVYQEQVMEIANKLANFSMVEADLLRMAMGKKKKELMEKGKKQFFENCLKRGYDKKMIEELFDHIEKFSAYGFNKPHSVSYAVIAYWTAYVKANYPVEFMTAYLTAQLHGSGPDKEQDMAKAVEECKNMGIVVLPPDVNRSQEFFTIEEGAIRFGLSAVKNVGAAAINSIIKARQNGPFTSLTDFLTRVDLRKVNKKTVESLIKAGSLADFGNRATLLKYYPQLVQQVVMDKDKNDTGQFGLFMNDHSVPKSDSFIPVPEYEQSILVDMEREVIGFLISLNPLAPYAKILDEKVTRKIADLSLDDMGKEFIFAGVINSIKIVKTKKDNSEMAIVTFNDGSGAIEIVVFPKIYVKLKSLMQVNKTIILRAKVDQREDNFNLIIDNAYDLEKYKQIVEGKIREA